MNKVETKTDNSFLEEKVYLRLSNLPKLESIKVLDCYAGKSIIWNEIKKRSKKQINIIGIDKKQYGVNLKGENLKYIPSINLNNFDVIDLDAYGIPYKQLKLIFDRKYKGILFITFIQSMFGSLPKQFLIDLGYKKAMIKKCPTLFYKNGIEKFKNWLAFNDIKAIKRLSYNNKHYIYCKIN